MKKYPFYMFLLGLGSLLNINPVFAKHKLGNPSDDAKMLRQDIAKLGKGMKKGIQEISHGK